MRSEIKLLSFFTVLIFCLYIGAKNVQAQRIINSGPNYWTLSLDNGDKFELDPFSALGYKASLKDTLFIYAFEIEGNHYISHGFAYLVKSDGDFYLDELVFLTILLKNTNDEKIFVEYHKYGFIMKAFEIREVEDIYITHDLVARIKVSYLGANEGLVLDSKYLGIKKARRIYIKL